MQNTSFGHKEKVKPWSWDNLYVGYRKYQVFRSKIKWQELFHRLWNGSHHLYKDITAQDYQPVKKRIFAW